MGRLSLTNLHKEYPNLGKRIAYKQLIVKPLLQADYGEDNDCTLTSICYIFGDTNYSLIERVAKKYGYRGDKGTNPLAIKRIIEEVANALGKKMTVYACYGKGACYTYDTIKRVIDSGNVALLNIWNDGRKFYHNHTVTAIGYSEYEHGKFILVNDNWSKVTSYVDYDKLSFISSINYVKE